MTHCWIALCELRAGVKIVDAACAEISEELFGSNRLKNSVGGGMGLISGSIDECGHAGVHIQLARFFFDGHAADEVVDTLFDGQGGLPVGRQRLC